MNDLIQQGLQNLAYTDSLTRSIFMFCASTLVYLLAVVWVIIAAWCWQRLTIAMVVRMVVVAVVAYLLSIVLTHIVSDPRPYITGHVVPLIDVSHDNGFPSDHTLLVSVLAAWLWWIDRRAMPYFLIGVVLVMAGRLGVGAHHTLDVVGSVLIVLVATLIARSILLPVAWSRPLIAASSRRAS